MSAKKAEALIELLNWLSSASRRCGTENPATGGALQDAPRNRRGPFHNQGRPTVSYQLRKSQMRGCCSLTQLTRLLPDPDLRPDPGVKTYLPLRAFFRLLGNVIGEQLDAVLMRDQKAGASIG